MSTLGPLVAADETLHHQITDTFATVSQSVLLGHGHQPAVGPGPRRPAGVGEQHERQQPSGLAVAGQ